MLAEHITPEEVTSGTMRTNLSCQTGKPTEQTFLIKLLGFVISFEVLFCVTTNSVALSELGSKAICLISFNNVSDIEM